MKHVRRGFAFTVALLIFGGCGAQSPVVDASADDPPSSAATPTDTPPETSSTTPTETETPPLANTPSPISAPVTLPPSELVDLSLPTLDPFGFPLLGLVDTPDLLSMLADFLAFDLFVPPAPGGLVDDYTHLELLCLEGDDPDFVCRQRYGP